MEKKMIDKMVDRFLCWKLPMDFAPDCGISFDSHNGQCVPVGTNLLTATQARQMFEHVTAEEFADGLQPLGRKISDRAHAYVCECEEIAADAIHNVCRPLLMAGDGVFYAKNGNFIAYDVVLWEHKMMQTALEKIRDKLDFAKTEIIAE